MCEVDNERGGGLVEVEAKGMAGLDADVERCGGAKSEGSVCLGEIVDDGEGKGLAVENPGADEECEVGVEGGMGMDAVCRRKGLERAIAAKDGVVAVWGGEDVDGLDGLTVVVEVGAAEVDVEDAKYSSG
jgi:hypothetical protein